jgi:NADP-dependent 3-hydroxy acid dehydrogenase YdfG
MEAPEALSKTYALVTGASSGIGKALALRLADAGSDLCLLGRNEDAMLEVAQQVGHRSVNIECTDLGDERSVAESGTRLAQMYPRIDVLVHSAGLFQMGSWADLALPGMDELYRVNFRAPVALTQLLLPSLQAAQGQIVFINSSAAVQTASQCGAYSAFKSALKQYADSLRQEVNRDHIRVVSVYPGRTATPMQERIYADEGRNFDSDRLLQPEDIAEQIAGALSLPRTAEVTDVFIRPFRPSPD